jgi:hypothetical protein
MKNNKKIFISNSLIYQKVEINRHLQLKIIVMKNNKFINNKIISSPLRIQRKDLYNLA